MVRDERSATHGLKRERCLPVRRQTEHKGSVIGQRKRFTHGVDLRLCDAVGREFVAVEDPAHAGQFGGTGQFPAEARQLCPLLIQRFCSKQTRHSGEGEAQHHVALFEPALDHARRA